MIITGDNSTTIEAADDQECIPSSPPAIRANDEESDVESITSSVDSIRNGADFISFE